MSTSAVYSRSERNVLGMMVAITGRLGSICTAVVERRVGPSVDHPNGLASYVWAVGLTQKLNAGGGQGKHHIHPLVKIEGKVC